MRFLALSVLFLAAVFAEQARKFEKRGLASLNYGSSSNFGGGPTFDNNFGAHGGLGGTGSDGGLGNGVDGTGLGNEGTTTGGQSGDGNQATISHITLTKQIPYPVPHPVPVPVENRVPYPVRIPVAIQVDRPYPVHVPKPYPVPVDKPVPYQVVKSVPVPVSYPVRVPYPVNVPVPVSRPYPVHISRPVPVHIPTPVIVRRPVPYPVQGGNGGIGSGIDGDSGASNIGFGEEAGHSYTGESNNYSFANSNAGYTGSEYSNGEFGGQLGKTHTSYGGQNDFSSTGTDSGYGKYNH